MKASLSCVGVILIVCCRVLTFLLFFYSHPTHTDQKSLRWPCYSVCGCKHSQTGAHVIVWHREKKIRYVETSACFFIIHIALMRCEWNVNVSAFGVAEVHFCLFQMTQTSNRPPCPLKGEWTLHAGWQLTDVLMSLVTFKNMTLLTLLTNFTSSLLKCIIFVSSGHVTAPNAKRQILLRKVRPRGCLLPRKVKV